jgi:hypothetical protein
MRWSKNYKEQPKYIYYYTLDEQITIDFIPYVGSSSYYSGTTMSRLTDSSYSKYIDGEIGFVGYRFKPSSLFDSKPRFNETITLKTPEGMLVASQTYEDSGTTYATEVDSVNFLIHNAVGRFRGKTRVLFKYYTINGRKIRTVEVL